MKGIFQHLRVLAATVTLLSLAACGGSTVTNVSMGGTVTGLTSGTVTLTNGLSTVVVPTNAAAYVFPSRTTVGLTYNVTVLTQPVGLTCSVANGLGVASTSDITNVAVTCATNNLLGGTVAGLKFSGLSLANGSDTVVVQPNSDGSNVSFVFPTKVVTGAAYGVTILSQPAPQTCSVANGAAIMGSGPVTSVSVTCI